MINYTLFHVGLTTVFVVVPLSCAGMAAIGAAVENRVYHGVLAALFLCGLLILMVNDQTVLRRRFVCARITWPGKSS
jgi:hypothetical protein